MTHEPLTPVVLVGVDASAASDRAIGWARSEAARRGGEVHLLRALPAQDVMAVTFVATLDPKGMDDVLEGAVRRLDDRWPDVPVRHEMVIDTPGNALVQASLDADLLVVGARGARSGLARAVLGSTALHVATRAHCPVVVLPDESTPAAVPAGTTGAPVVVVGFDGSSESCTALGVAAEEAALAGAHLRVVQAWTTEVIEGAVVTTPGSYHWKRLREQQEARLAEHLEPVRRRHPELAVEQRIVWGAAREVLHAESRDASLVVVGTRGRGRVRRTVLGSVSTGVLHDSTAPVMLVHESAARRRLHPVASIDAVS